MPRTIHQLLSEGRLEPYRRAAGDEPVAALALHEWNTRVSGAFFESLHYLEVGLRNVIDDAISEGSALGGDWLAGDSRLLTPSSRRRIREAVSRASLRAEDSPSHGKVIAELSFGFWWSLLADEYDRPLWQPYLRRAFEGSVRRRRMHSELDALRLLRNRIAHHEPIHHRNLDDDARRLMDLADRIALALGEHIRATSRIGEVLAVKPGSRGVSVDLQATRRFPTVELGRPVTSDEVADVIDEDHDV